MTANDETGRRGAFPAYVLLFATLYAGFGVMSPFLPALLQARGLRPEDIGLALALSTVVRLVSGPVAGRVADRLGALRSVFAASATAAAVCGLGFLPAHGFFQVVAVSVLYAAMLAPLTTTADALALSAAGPPTGKQRHFEYGWVRGAGSAAFRIARTSSVAVVPGTCRLFSFRGALVDGERAGRDACRCGTASHVTKRTGAIIRVFSLAADSSRNCAESRNRPLGNMHENGVRSLFRVVLALPS